jgi:hypothetical protein
VGVGLLEEWDEAPQEDDDDEFGAGSDLGPRRLDHRLYLNLKKPLGLFLAEEQDGLIVSEVSLTRRRPHAYMGPCHGGLAVSSAV